MSIDARAEQFSREFVEKLSVCFEGDLISVVLYGSAMGSYYAPGKSNINLLVVLREVETEKLRVASKERRKFAIYGIEPIYLSAREFERLGKDFPIEAVELRESHRILFGDDLTQKLQISKSALHDQLIRELIAKNLRARANFEEHQKDWKRLDAFLRELISPYRILMRAILRSSYNMIPPPQEFLEILAQIEERLGVPFEGFREAFLLKSGQIKPAGEEIRSLFERILNETDFLVDYLLDYSAKSAS